MAIGLFIFALIFVLRDAQVLALRDNASIASRAAVYGVMQLGAIMLMAGICERWPVISQAWTDRRFAMAAVLIQLGELGIAFALKTFAAERFAWVGWLLPSPTFLVALFGLGFLLEGGLSLSRESAIQMVVVSWLSLVGAAAGFLHHVGSVREDRTFAGDFALLTGCTAMIFVPAGFF